MRFAKRSKQVVAALCLASALSFANEPIDAVTFAAYPGAIYLPLDQAARELQWEVLRDESGQCIRLHHSSVKAASLRCLCDGTELIDVSAVRIAGASIDGCSNDSELLVRHGMYRFTLLVGAKHTEVDLAAQQLRCWQGSRLVMQTHISSGRNGRTPTGTFTAGPFRSRMHYSHLYQNAPMPWSVQIYGHVFIHGFDSVPDYPASHGCIRVPLDGCNPARFFYEWIDDGSIVVVTRSTSVTKDTIGFKSDKAR